METQTGNSFIPSTPMTDDDMAAAEQDYRDHRAARWCAWPNYERTRSYKQDVALAAAEAFMAANPVDPDDTPFFSPVTSERTINVRIKVGGAIEQPPIDCPECDGKGDAGRNNPANICEECNGTGKFTVKPPAAIEVWPRPCPSCESGNDDWCWYATPCPRPCDDCKRGNHARCLPTGNCNCCNRVEVAA